MRIDYHKRPNEIPIKPIVCPRCKNKDITIITEYHKSLFCRIIKAICLIALVTLAIYYFFEMRDKNKQLPIPIIIILAVAYVTAECVQQYMESKTHIQCICKDCGNYWLHNED